MRTSGAETNKMCWKVSVKLNENVIFDKEYPSLKKVGSDLGFSYNRISEMANGRIKHKGGTFEPVYVFERI